MNVACTVVLVAVFFIMLAFSVGAVVLAVFEHRLRKEGQAQKKIADEAYSGFCEVVNDIEKMETGNNASDFNGSIELLHDIAKGKNRK